MKCFEITINGENICTAGIGEDGVLNTIVSFIRRNSSAETEDSPNNISESLDIRVTGIANREGGQLDHLDWLHRDLHVGDEVVIKIIEAREAGEPEEKKVTYLACSFCGLKQGEVAKLIAGPEVFICSECVGSCNRAIELGEPTGDITIVVRETGQAMCSFCGKKPVEVDGIVGVPTARICNQCLAICGNILAGDV